ncbi:MAG: AbrB/MazE/SpoVT family DNA-binding domain-containing protein [Ginsengibacter sp.]
METSILTTKGQLLIPRRIRNKYGIKSGVRVAFLETQQGVIIKPMDTAYFESFAGLYKDSLPPAEEYGKWKKEEIQLEEEKINRVFKAKNKY